MRCPACSFDNPEGLKFCGNCGGRMPERAIGSTPERRVVTSLFADVKGSTSLAEKLDPEDWHEIVDGLFKALRPAVDRYGGTLVREFGDGLLAFFGAPVAHEDDPERSVRAGLEMLQATGAYRERLVRERGAAFRDFDVRIGINTGMAVIGFVGDKGVEYTGQGDAVTVAARLQSMAAPGTLVVSEHTLKLVPPVFEWEPLGELELKGREGKTGAFVVRGLSATGSRVRPRDLLTPLVGRTRELQALRDAVGEVRRGGGAIVSLIADAGLGKTRLIDELRKEWDAQPVAGQKWSEARGQSYEVDRSYGLVRQHLLSLAGATDADAPEVIHQRVIELLPPERRADEAALRALGVFLGVTPSATTDAPEGQELRDQVHGLMREIVRSLAERQAVIVFDDLQWIDAASADLLGEIVDLAEQTPVLFILAFRPDRQATSWKIKQKLETDLPHRYSEVMLPTLTSAESTELLASVLPGEDLPASLATRIIDKAEGNPFFLEEIVRSLIDDGAVERGPDGRWRMARADAEIGLPESLQSVLAARIDRLQLEQRETLQAAAVIGRTFLYRILATIREATEKLDRQLLDLQRLQIVREEAREPEREYAFRHALTQEAAYSSILQRKRRELHTRVGEALEALFPERVEEEEFGAMIARHYAEAHDPRALRYLRMAGDRALRLLDLEGADAHYRRALTFLKRDASDDAALVRDLYVRYGRVFELRGEYARAMELYRELEKLGQDRSDAAMEGAALSAQMVLFTNPTPFLNAAKAAEILGRQIAMARDRGDKGLLAKLLWSNAQASFWRGEVEGSIGSALESEAIAREIGDKEQLGFTLNQLGQAYVHGGRVREGEEPLRESVALFHEIGNKPMEADGWSTLAFLYFYGGDLDGGQQSGERAFEIADSVNNDWGRAYGLFTPSFVHNERGDWGRAIEVYEDAIRYAERGGFLAGRTAAGADLGLLFATVGAHDSAQSVLEMAITNARDNFPIWKDWPTAQAARAALRRGDIDQARARLGELAEEPPVVGDVYMGAVIALARSEYALASGDPVAAIEAARVGRRYADKRNLVPFQDDFDLAEGEAQFRAGDLAAAASCLTRAISAAHRRGTRRLLWRCLGVLAAVLETQGRGDEARQVREEASAVVDHIARSLSARGLEASFRAQPAVAEATGRVPAA
jgi:class 3 adenylate cyclase/tetratricopeptide (TPR) repeat protein